VKQNGRPVPLPLIFSPSHDCTTQHPEMSDAPCELCFFIDGKRSISTVFVTPNETIGDLKEKIYHKADRSFVKLSALDLILTKVRYHIMVPINTDVTMASTGLLHP